MSKSPRKSSPPARPGFTRDELVIINNALNEVCHGVQFDDDEFETRIGYARPTAQKLLKRIAKLLGK
jgi:hypothetical protein